MAAVPFFVPKEIAVSITANKENENGIVPVGIVIGEITHIIAQNSAIMVISFVFSFILSSKKSSSNIIIQKKNNVNGLLTNKNKNVNII